ncbi:MAG TPA: hypothetical protein VFZ21_04175 [Gemmatimonadaceae bacterium]|jgi:hypothetical protein|nr:hypothetical protein [Gemmatimonadaceae bacterium]
MVLLRHILVVAATAVILPLGPYDIILLNTPRTPAAKGTARLLWAQGPFGVTVTADGRASYDVQLSLTGLPEPSTLGPYKTYVAWAATTNLDAWHRLGVVGNGNSTVGKIELNKFMLVITAEATATATERKGPTVLHGISPSGWLQSMTTHPLFRGVQ